MTTLTSSGTFTIGESLTEQASTTVTVLPVAAPGEGRGRLVHPTLGSYDYPYAPDEWDNLHQDVIIPPVWAHARTLEGAQNTLWPGHIKDVRCAERWISDISMPIAMLEMLLLFWTNPPDPATGYVVWYPSYATVLGYQVIIEVLTVGGNQISLDYIARQGWTVGVVEQTLRIVDYAQ